MEQISSIQLDVEKQKIKKEYDSRKEANVQIDMLRDIVLRGRQTKSELTRNLKYPYKTIDIALTRDGGKKSGRMFQPIDSIVSKKNIKQPRYSLTEDGIYILLTSHFKTNEENDQKRISTPELAIKNGSSLLVIGRPILAAEDRKLAAIKILTEIEECLKQQ